MKKTTGELATITGRYFAMDRDKRWERIKLAYDAVVNSDGEKSTDAIKSIEQSYSNDVTDEFIKPIIMTNENGQPKTQIKADDVVIFFNYRTDRGRELTEVLTQKDYPDFGMKIMPLYYVTLTSYDDTFKNIHIIYETDNLENTLGEVLEKTGKKQIRIAESEKYPHVTFFFSGGRENTFENETRILCPSPKVATYDLKPEMSAFDIRDAIIPELDKKEVDFVCLNFANGDMVGHTGVMEAAIKACEAVDKCVEDVVASALKNDYTTIIIADHGNCETMINPDGTPNTSHTTNPVPVILVDKDLKHIEDGVLGDIAPTILSLMGIEKPEVMTRHSLI
jgi:2,3-bisphosphoglycerate-independent phosphoglycerate mutase